MDSHPTLEHRPCYSAHSGDHVEWIAALRRPDHKTMCAGLPTEATCTVVLSVQFTSLTSITSNVPSNFF